MYAEQIEFGSRQRFGMGPGGRQASSMYLDLKDVHFYAKALGMRAKTDKVDAGVIVRYVAEHHQSLHPWQPGT